MIQKPKSFFTDLINNGQFVIDKSGHAVLFGEYVILFPSKIVLELVERLTDKIGSEEAYRMLLDLAKLQVGEACKRYISRFGIKTADKTKILEFFIKIVDTLGWGGIAVKSVSFKEKTFEVLSKNTVLSLRFKEKYKINATRPTDVYLLGVIQKMFECLLEVELDVVESSCMAMGHSECRFVGKPKK